MSEVRTQGAVIVSGATFGIGKDIALLLAQRGWPVVAFGLATAQISSVASADIAALQREAQAAGLTIAFVEGDVTSEADLAMIVERAVGEHQAIHGLVNNAAIGPLGTVMDTPPEVWDRIHAVNLKGPYLASRAVIGHMQRSGGGRIVNVGSGAGWGKPNMAAYAASKGGLVAFSAALALDHFADGIAVNTVIPGGGGIASGMSLGRVDGDLAKLRANAVGNVAGRYTTGEDIAKAVAFLLSEDAEAISGTIIDVGCFAHQGSSQPLPAVKRGG